MDSSSPTCAQIKRETKRIAPTNSMAVSPSSSEPVAMCSMMSQQPSTSGMTASGNDLTSLFECPVCFDFVLPPIIQCQNGHLVCSSCRQKLTSCPTCRVPISNTIRNLPMEKLATTMMFPCKYSSSGCAISLLYTDKPDHEDSCDFKPYSCPCPGSTCKWYGPLEQVMPHLMHQHKSITTLQGEDIVFLATDINLSGAVDWVMIQSCYQHHFMLVLEKQEKYHGYVSHPVPRQFWRLVASQSIRS